MQVVQLEYEAYEAFAVKEMRKVCGAIAGTDIERKKRRMRRKRRRRRQRRRRQRGWRRRRGRRDEGEAFNRMCQQTDSVMS